MRFLSLLTLGLSLGLTLAACDSADPEAVSAPGVTTSELPGSASLNGVVHRVIAGTPDYDIEGDGPGDDRNFSSNIVQRADGTVRGTHTDVAEAVGGGSDMVHGTVDCLRVEGNTAYYGGEITTGTFAGLRYLSAVRDNGTSQQDTPDEISFTYLFLPTEDISCDGSAFPYLAEFNPVEKGQVIVE